MTQTPGNHGRAALALPAAAFLFAGFAAPAPAAGADKEGTVDFKKQVLPIFSETCFKCHGPPRKSATGRLVKHKGGLRLDSPTFIKKGGDNGKVLEPGKPDKSSIYTLTTLDPDDDDIMPAKGDPLKKEQIAIIKKWIEEGAKFGDWKGVDAKGKEGEGAGEKKSADAGAEDGAASTTPVVAAEGSIYEQVVQPIVAARCAGCHGADKSKGKLRLHTPDGIVKGGENGEVIAAGDIAKSELYLRVILPRDHEDAMPPEGKKQLTKDQIALLRWWIEEGASFDKKVADAKKNEAIETILAGDWKPADGPAAAGGGSAHPLLAKAPPAADAAVLKAIEEAGILIMPLAQNTTWLSANCLSVAKEFGDDDVKVFLTAAEQLTWLDASDTQISDAGATHLSQLGNLTRLHLEKSKVTDKALPHLGKLDKLEYLNLYGTEVSDDGIVHLGGLKNLKKVFLWQTKVTDAGAEALKKLIPGVDVNLGWKAPVEAEPTAEEKEAAKKVEELKVKLAALYDKGSCCDQAHGKGELCSHGCCKKAFEKGEVCKKCNPKAEKTKA